MTTHNYNSRIYLGMEPTKKTAASLISILILDLIIFATGLRDTRAKEFLLGFTDNRVLGNETFPRIYVTTSKTSVVHVEVISPNWNDPYLKEQFTVTAGQVKQVDVGSNLRMAGAGLSTKGILVNATDEVTVYGVDAEEYSTDAFLGLPTDVIGTKYYAVTSFPCSHETQFLVVGTEESTRVNIQLSNNTNAIDIVFNETTYNPGDSITLVLNRYDTFQVQSKGDLTGSLITSDRPISFFSGNKHTYIEGPIDNNNGHLVEQLLPVETWGSRFGVISTPTATSGDYLKLITSSCETTILYSCNNAGNPSFHTSQTVLEGAGDVYQIFIGPENFCYLESNSQILVIQYAFNKHLSDPYRDPTMIMIPPIQHYSAEYTFATPTRSNGGVFTNMFVFVTTSQEVEDLRLDGNNVNSSTYNVIPRTNLSAGYFEISHGIHTVRQTSSSSVLYGVLYGQMFSEAYGFPLGFRLEGAGEKCSQEIKSEGYSYRGRSGKFVNVEGSRNIVSGTIWQQNGIASMVSCAALCLQDNTCTAYTYNIERRICRGHVKDTCRSGDREDDTAEEGFNHWICI